MQGQTPSNYYYYYYYYCYCYYYYYYYLLLTTYYLLLTTYYSLLTTYYLLLTTYYLLLTTYYLCESPLRPLRPLQTREVGCAPRRLRNFSDRFPQTSCETSTRDEGVLVLRSTQVSAFGPMGIVVSPYDPLLGTVLRWCIQAP